MTVAIVHYHLQPGGVTRVIAAASRALTAAGVRHVILCSSQGSDLPDDLPVRWVEALRYPSHPTGATAADLVSQLRSAAHEALGGAPDLWHFHNHSLGKHLFLPEVVSQLAAAAERLVLQIHDLAEDGRPENYRRLSGCEVLYPVAPHIHYAFLNSRDLALFRHAGLPEAFSRLLPNPVPLPPHAPLPSGAPLVLYPVRGIRRKNLGEVLLLAALAPAGCRFAITRAPDHSLWKSRHDAWQAFAARHRLPVEFDVVGNGSSDSLASWQRRATHFLTTSIAEGFGLTYLESVAHGRPLIGRNLPHITRDHPFAIGSLYEALLVPDDWIDLDSLRDQLRRTLVRTYQDYGRPLPEETIAAAFAALQLDGFFDFGNLPEPLQQTVIERALCGPQRDRLLLRSGRHLHPARPWLAQVLEAPPASPPPQALADYAPEAYQHRLLSLYQALLQATPSACTSLPPQNLLDLALHPASFRFLTCEP